MTPDNPKRRTAAGHMVVTPAEAEPYKAVIYYEDGHTAEHPFSSLQAGEAFLRTHNAMVWPAEPLRATPRGSSQAE